MKKILLIFTTILTVSLTACSDHKDGSDKEFGTGEVDPSATMTSPDETSTIPTTNPSDTLPKDSVQKGVPGSDNPRKNDINGQPHPMDTASNKVKK